MRGNVSFGDSVGTLNLLASVRYRVAGPFGLRLGYRCASIEIEDIVDSTPVPTEIALNGPYLGFAFRF